MLLDWMARKFSLILSACGGGGYSLLRYLIEHFVPLESKAALILSDP